MTGETGAPARSSASADAAPTGGLPGRTRITGRALTQLTAAIAATVLEVPLRQVRASVSDASGELGIRVQSPMIVRPLTRTDLRPGDLPRAEPVVLRAERARVRIADQVTALSGHRVGAVTLEATGALIRERGRVS
ncbi:hypothetical protein [Leucobacter sp.]